jgi:hypothetical protein
MSSTFPGEPLIESAGNVTQPCSNSFNTLYGTMCAAANSDQLSAIRRLLQVVSYIIVAILVLVIIFAAIWRYLVYRLECSHVTSSAELPYPAEKSA